MDVFEDCRHPPTMGLRCIVGAGAFGSVRGARVLSSRASGPIHCGRRNSVLAPPGAWHTPRQPAATPLAGYSTRGRNLTSYQAGGRGEGSTAALMKSPSQGEGHAACLQNGHAIRSADLSRLRALPESLESISLVLSLSRA